MKRFQVTLRRTVQCTLRPNDGEIETTITVPISLVESATPQNQQEIDSLYEDVTQEAENGLPGFIATSVECLDEISKK